MFILKSKYKKLEERCESLKYQLEKYKNLAQKHCPHNRCQDRHGISTTLYRGGKIEIYPHRVCLDCGKILDIEYK